MSEWREVLHDTLDGLFRTEQEAILIEEGWDEVSAKEDLDRWNLPTRTIDMPTCRTCKQPLVKFAARWLTLAGFSDFCKKSPGGFHWPKE